MNRLEYMIIYLGLHPLLLAWFTWLTRRVRFSHYHNPIAFRSGLCKLNISTDIDEEEFCVVITGLLKRNEEVSAIISMMVLENCEGCRVDYSSQRHHDCLLMEDDQKMWLYLDSALEKVSEAKVVETFMNSLRDLKPTENGLELLKYSYM